MKKRDFLTLSDYSKEEVKFLIQQGYNLKSQHRVGKKHELLAGKSLAMIFDKPSTRTRVSFDIAMYHLGGHSVNITAAECGLGTRESVADVARTLSRFCDGIMVRTFGHEIVDELAKYATVPVINGLTDSFHPCQALADGLTIYEVTGKLAGTKLTYIGDANNVSNSLIQLADKTGIELTICTPKGFSPDPAVVKSVKQKPHLENDVKKAVASAEFIYTDTWVSMGQEEEAAKKVKAFKNFQLNAQLLKAAPKDVKIMHCLPAHRGQEITDDVMDSENSIVFDQAENRLHVQKSVLVFLLK
jgi:ornithine carbamoyltransferase